jgi:putative endonuclease
MMKDTRKQLGAEGERRAEEYLVSSGCRILAKNWRCRSGELDLVAEANGCILFVEVRSRRRTGSYGIPQESVTPAKQRQVRELAQRYLLAQRLRDVPVRFDVIAVHFERDGTFADLEHICGAF